MDEVEKIPLNPAEALALAGRARAEGERPRPLPTWYGPVAAVALAVDGVMIGQSWEQDWPWMGWLNLLLWAAFIAVLGVRVARAQGVRGLNRPADWVVALVVMGSLLFAVAAGITVRVLTGDVGWAYAAWGIISGAGTWCCTSLHNKRIEQRHAGTGR